MAVPRYMTGSNVRNPGNGDFAVWPNDPGVTRFTSITITQNDPAVPLSGVLTFSLGAYSATIDLAANARFLGCQRVPMLFLNIAGANITENWSYVLS